MSDIPPIDRLVALEDIKQVKARYFRGIDTKDRALLRSVFEEDATCDFRGAMHDPRDASSGKTLLEGGELLQGGDAITAAILAAVKELTTVHHGMMPEIALHDADRATGIWPMVDWLSFPPGADVAEIIGWGHYHDTYVRVDGVWRIATLRLERLRLDLFRPAET